MRVLLLEPPFENMLKTNAPKIVEEERGCYPPPGILYVAAYAEKYTPHKIFILDCNIEGVTHKTLGEKIEKIKPDIVGITVTSLTLIDSLIAAKNIKRIDKEIKIVFGGPHPMIYDIETINLKEVDYLIKGEGEIPFTELLNNFDDPLKLKKTRGLVFKHNKKIINGGDAKFIENLDELPFPARHLTPYKKYYSPISKRNPITSMITSRGCPYKCIYCDRPQLGKSFRARSANNVVNEMEICRDMGIEEIMIYDDTFTIDRKRVIDICNEIFSRKLDILWDMRARVNTVDTEMLRKLKKAGCERIHYGVESGNQIILNVLRKGITLKGVEDAFRNTRKVGINTLAYFMLGNPTETRKEILQTIKFAVKIKPDFAYFSITTLYPATDMYMMALEKGILSKDLWKEYAEKPDKNFETPFWEANLSATELIEFQKNAYKQFYLNPQFILKQLLRTKSFNQFKNSFRIALKLFGGY